MEKLFYEMHVTVQNADKEKFKAVCEQLGVKPIILDIQTKDGNSIYEEVMTSSTKGLSSDADAHVELTRIADRLRTEGFEVIREKIEASIEHEDASKCLPNTYLESHLNVYVAKGNDVGSLKRICKKYDLHLSRNKNKVFDNCFTIMCTYRVSTTKEKFLEHIENVCREIEKVYTIDKTIVEYAFYDTNISYDKQWLDAR